MVLNVFKKQSRGRYTVFYVLLSVFEIGAWCPALTFLDLDISL